MLHWTWTAPSAPTGTMALLARVRPAAKLRALARGAVPPAERRRLPAAPGLTAMALPAKAAASAGRPQAPATAKDRVLLASSGACERRVSVSRQAATRWKERAGSGGSFSCRVQAVPERTKTDA